MALVAQSRLEYSNGDKSVVVEEGQVVKSGDFPKEVLDRFKEIGSVVEPPSTAGEDAAEKENEALKARVADLEAKLAEASKPKEPEAPKAPATASDKK